jgi:hypothetical protein
MVITSPFLRVTPEAVSVPGAVVDPDRAGAGDAGLAHAARHHGGVRGHAAARRQDALGRVHAVDVLGRGLDAHEDDALPCAFRFSASSEENTISPAAAPGEAGRPVATILRVGLRVDGRMQQLVERAGVDALHRLLGIDDAFVGEIDRDLQRRLGSALAGARLQHPELAFLDGELDVLHVAIMPLEMPCRSRQNSRIGLRHHRLHRRLVGVRGEAGGLGDVLRRADAGDDVLALRVDQELAVERLLAGRGVAGEGDAGRRGVAHIAEHHRLHVDGGAPGSPGCC